MAIIQNSAIIQKLVDELELSPALEKIPTELADKILPVFQVNSETLEIQIKPNYFLWQDVALNDADKTLTVPDGYTYVIKHGLIKITTTASAGTRGFVLSIKDKAGNDIWHLEMSEQTASKTWYFHVSDLDWKGQTMDNVNYTARSLPLPKDFAMLEGWTLQIIDEAGIALTADDLLITFIVDKQKD